MYTEQDLNNANAMLRRRRLAVWPAFIVLSAGAIALFVYGQVIRSESLWAVSGAVEAIVTALLIFFLGCWVKPAKVYRNHVNEMLHGRKSVTTGRYKAFSKDVSDRDGLNCHAMMLNIGTADDPEDDRLFYYDDVKPEPTFAIGDWVTVESNNKQVASIVPAAAPQA